MMLRDGAEGDGARFLCMRWEGGEDCSGIEGGGHGWGLRLGCGSISNISICLKQKTGKTQQEDSPRAESVLSTPICSLSSSFSTYPPQLPLQNTSFKASAF